MPSILDKVYPVGSIYISTNVINPGTVFGGKWEEYGKGRVIVGQTLDDANFRNIGQVGGYTVHTLTEAEMPSHKHVLYSPFGHTIGTQFGEGKGMCTFGFIPDSVNANVAYGDDVACTENKGGNTPHNNLQPYIVARFWKRIE